MSLAPTIGELEWLAEKYNLGEEKIRKRARLAEKNLMCKDENCKFGDLWCL